MTALVLGLLLVAYLAYVGSTSWSRLQTHLAFIWMLMGLHLVGVILYAAYRLL